jgi:3-deoxy-D-manno-octulosonate 8-phosphate phosphatase KdsC-like HAD superfamily phosphatase
MSNTNDNKSNKKSCVKNIYQRINAVMDEVGYVQKDSAVNMPKFSYKAVSHDKVVATVRPFLISNGIVVTASQKEISTPFHIVQTEKPLSLFRAIYIVSFINIDKPEDKVSIEVEAHSMCTDDKSPGKTYSYAVKMAILKQFLLETGDNDESKHAPPEQISIVTKKQADELKEKAEKLGKTKQVLAVIDVQMFEQIPASKYEWTLKHLDKQINEAKAKTTS